MDAKDCVGEEMYENMMIIAKRNKEKLEVERKVKKLKEE